MHDTVIQAALTAAFASISPGLPPILSFPNPKFGGDAQCATALQAGSKNPRGLAQTIVDAMDLTGVAEASVTGPGFINFTLTDARIEQRLAAPIDFACQSGRIVLDFGGPNVAKELHVGHLRSFVIGESLRRILAAVGNEVLSDIHFGDWGLPVGKLFIGFATEHGSDVFRDAGHPLPRLDLSELGRLYRVGNEAAKSSDLMLQLARAATASLQAGDPAHLRLWAYVRQVSLEAISGHISDLSAHFDMLGGESDVNDKIDGVVADLVAAGIAHESDGALVGPASEDGSFPPVILRKSDGAALYGSTDVATLVDRISLHRPTKVVYCVDGRQSAHFRGLFDLARRAADAGVPGFVPLPELVHADFGTVNDADGKPYTTRDGKPYPLSALIEQAVAAARASQKADDDPQTARMVGVAALKFADLSGDRRSGYVFDAQRMAETTGRTGPYMQYACVRIASLLAKAGERGFDAGHARVASAADRALGIECLKLGDAVRKAAETLQPKEVCDAAYGIASAVARLYADDPVLQAPDEVRPGRLGLLAVAEAHLRAALHLLGIEVPGRM